jgi:hypothetical protein
VGESPQLRQRRAGASMTVQETTVKKVREHLSTARTMRRNLRLGLYQGRNGGGEGFRWHERQAEELMDDLPRDLQGHLRSEHKLAVRVSEGRDNGQQRPELRARLAAARRRIRDLTN